MKLINVVLCIFGIFSNFVVAQEWEAYEVECQSFVEILGWARGQAWGSTPEEYYWTRNPTSGYGTWDEFENNSRDEYDAVEASVGETLYASASMLGGVSTEKSITEDEFLISTNAEVILQNYVEAYTSGGRISYAKVNEEIYDEGTLEIVDYGSAAYALVYATFVFNADSFYHDGAIYGHTSVKIEFGSGDYISTLTAVYTSDHWTVTGTLWAYIAGEMHSVPINETYSGWAGLDGEDFAHSSLTSVNDQFMYNISVGQNGGTVENDLDVYTEIDNDGMIWSELGGKIEGSIIAMF